MNSPKRQPDYFFLSFLEAVKPAIEAFSPHHSPVWSTPYGLLLGFKHGTLHKWRSWRKIPEDAYQNASNILALQEIAFLDPETATVEDAKAIAATRLTDALLDTPEPKARKVPAARRDHAQRRCPRTTEDDAWKAVTLRAQGYRSDQIADELGCSMRTVQKLLKSVLGDYQPVGVGRPAKTKERELA